MEATWLDTLEAGGADRLAAEGVYYRRLDTDAAAYQPVMDWLKTEKGYIQQDIVQLTAETPNLPAILAKFDAEHLHAEDEVRFVLEGEGVFDIRSEDDRWMRVLVQKGDLIVVPKDRHHRFELTQRQMIRCVRLFQDMSGWVPVYRAAA